VQGLRRRGVVVNTVIETGQSGVGDEEILKYAKSLNACLFTHDDDFLRLARKWEKKGKIHSGIIYVHQQKLSIGEIVRKLKLLVETISSEEMVGHIEFL
jgi:predicted nuclease of predicted toxin-antitoxin system